ncbi:MAG: tRNA adenosine(34) deaminase TadA [Coxiellaceae bacterium]|nr:tRNA adenosine(34) deaminase TadA [Coxiellaceae bacterium]
MMNYQAQYMQRAKELAQQAANEGEVPVGAVIVHDNKVVGEGYNQPITHTDPTLHAEMVAIRAAAKQLDNYRLLECDLYVTLEPCPMCLGAMLYSRVKRLFFGAYDDKAGAVTSVFQLLDEPRLNHKIEWQGGIDADDCAQLLKDFFKQRR